MAQPTAPATSPVAHARRARCEFSEEGLAALSFSGTLPDRWLVRLTRSLAARGVSLVRGLAQRETGCSWRGRLDLDAGHAGAQCLAGFDFLAHAARGDPPAWHGSPEIFDLELEAEADAGALRVEVGAWDEVGLLAGVLERVARAGLRVDALELETEESCAFHALLLRRPCGGRPRNAERELLTRMLEACHV